MGTCFGDAAIGSLRRPGTYSEGAMTMASANTSIPILEARAIVFLLGDDASMITSVSLPIDGGYTCV